MVGVVEDIDASEQSALWIQPLVHFLLDDIQPTEVLRTLHYFENKRWIRETFKFSRHDTCLQQWMPFLQNAQSALDDFRRGRIFQSQNSGHIERRMMIRNKQSAFK